MEASDIMVCAAGSMPGDLHKLWRTRQPGGYHMEYGYSCMGYEIAGGLGVKMAYPGPRSVRAGGRRFVPDDGAGNRHRAAGRHYKLNIVLLDNHGFSSIGGLSRSCGNQGMGTEYRYRREGKYEGDLLPVDFEANAASLGAWTARCTTGEELKAALVASRKETRTSVVVIETAYDQRVPGYESWWDVPIAEVSEQETVKAARQNTRKRARRNATSFRKENTQACPPLERRSKKLAGLI